MAPLVEVKDLSVTYRGQAGSTQALEGVSLEIDRGDFALILGPSGCGKTTLLQVLAGFVDPSGGQALVGGQDLRGPSKDRGLVFQRTNLFPWLNVRENILFGPRLQDPQPDDLERTYDHYIQAMGLEDFQDLYPFELSGGMAQRVALARTLINGPDLVLMDEPFASLDAISRSQVQDFTRDLWARENFTACMVSHDIDEALGLATRIFVLAPSPGRLAGTFEVPFARRRLKDPSYRPPLDPDYSRVKEDILTLLSL